MFYFLIISCLSEIKEAMLLFLIHVYLLKMSLKHVYNQNKVQVLVNQIVFI